MIAGAARLGSKCNGPGFVIDELSTRFVCENSFKQNARNGCERLRNRSLRRRVRILFEEMLKCADEQRSNDILINVRTEHAPLDTLLDHAGNDMIAMLFLKFIAAFA